MSSGSEASKMLNKPPKSIKNPQQASKSLKTLQKASKRLKTASEASKIQKHPCVGLVGFSRCQKLSQI